MFSSSSDLYDDDFFKGHRVHEDLLEDAPVMEVVGTIVGVIGVAIVLALLCKCCHASKNRGRVLQPPPSAAPPPPPGLYPQQQYNTVTVPTAVSGQLVSVSYPTSAAPYPSGGAPYPSGGAPYPSGGAPYPSGGAPYPSGGAPYPAVAPYPATSPYPAPMPHLGAAGPSAPDQHALPPSYDQVMSSESAKHPPYNPYPH